MLSYCDHDLRLAVARITRQALLLRSTARDGQHRVGGTRAEAGEVEGGVEVAGGGESFDDVLTHFVVEQAGELVEGDFDTRDGDGGNGTPESITSGGRGASGGGGGFVVADAEAGEAEVGEGLFGAFDHFEALRGDGGAVGEA